MVVGLGISGEQSESKLVPKSDSSDDAHDIDGDGGTIAAGENQATEEIASDADCGTDGTQGGKGGLDTTPSQVAMDETD